MPITVTYGDGVGPEIMNSTLAILKKAAPELQFEFIEVGQKLYKQGYLSGISPESMETVKRNKILLKAPITTPQGGGYKSLNVTFRKSLELFANIRPVRSIPSASSCIDMVIVRENEEDLYSGIEYRSTQNSFLSMKLLSRIGCMRIIQYAFEYARCNGRKKVTCMVKDNIMKITDGLFHAIFNKIGSKYNDIEKEIYIIDIGAARIAKQPENFDVIVTLNLYGDIISDIAAEISGSIGVAGSANIGSMQCSKPSMALRPILQALELQIHLVF